MLKYINKPIYRWLFPLVYKKAKVILLSWHLYSDIEKVVNRENVLICPNGIKTSVDLNYVHIPNVIPHILFLSNLLIAKGVLVLLDALKILKDSGYSFICDFVGGETKEIDAIRFSQEVETRGLNHLAIYNGLKFGEEKNAYFKQADLFVFPSLNEAFGIVAIEAMEYGIPIVASKEGGIQDIVINKKNGYTVDKGNPIILAEALKKLLQNPDLCIQMGLEGRKLFNEKYTEAIFEKRFLQCLFKSLE